MKVPALHVAFLRFIHLLHAKAKQSRRLYMLNLLPKFPCPCSFTSPTLHSRCKFNTPSAPAVAGRDAVGVAGPRRLPELVHAGSEAHGWVPGS